ncbi:hypothetical protein KKG41_03355 [Patescibacteria group bacterium]|nr:hypothetical protein [Patescibacteria group bacterium]MBU1890110.1 hypothetical protein [Patescibacteria group bacterium]
MIFTNNLLQKYGFKLVWVISVLCILWVTFLDYQVVDQAILNPPIIEQQQLSDRQNKINTQLFESVIQYHAKKIETDKPEPLKTDPFEGADLDTDTE